MFKIGNIKIKNNVCLAPMAGVSNPAYMKICEEMGAGYAVTELISAEAIIRGNKKTFDMLNGIDKLSMPVGVQLFGSSPDVMAEAAKIITKTYKNVFIDINMGCPVPKVAIKSGAGSALLKSPDKIYDIVKSVKENVNVPVTVKIRSGWDQNSINAVEVARVCEKAGASLIAVHPRTRSQGYTGKADWNIIKKVKESVNIPVVGNGDILTMFDAKRMIDETRCDAVMLGRGLLGNPYLIKQITEYFNTGNILDDLSYVEKIKICLKHFNYLLEIKPEKVAVLEMRTNASWYLKGLPNGVSIKKRLYETKTKEEFVSLITEYMEKLRKNVL